MALQRDTRYPGRWTTGNAAHPQGAFKNRTAPGSLDGSYIEQDWANDWDGFFAALLGAASITPNGNVDTATSSQYFTAMQAATKGRLIGIQTFPTAGTFTYTPTAGTTSIIVEVVGGGGGGGGAPATGASVSSIGVGGCGGTYAKGRFTSAFSGVTITVGVGGTGGTGVTGGNGGTSSFGALISCPGGGGGTTAGPSGSAYLSGGVITTGQTGGNIFMASGMGPATCISLSATSLTVGMSGGSQFGPGTQVAVGSAGANATTAGGGGSGTGLTPSLAALKGGNGAAGLVVVWEYN